MYIYEKKCVKICESQFDKVDQRLFVRKTFDIHVTSRMADFLDVAHPNVQPNLLDYDLCIEVHPIRNR